MTKNADCLYEELLNQNKNISIRKLYLNLSRSAEQEYDNQKYYDFRFLTVSEFVSIRKNDFWFLVKDSLNLDDLINNFLIGNYLMENDYVYDKRIKIGR